MISRETHHSCSHSVEQEFSEKVQEVATGYGGCMADGFEGGRYNLHFIFAIQIIELFLDFSVIIMQLVIQVF